MFDDAKSKVDWARGHIRSLESEVERFFALGAYGLVVEDDTSAGRRALRFRKDRALPTVFSLLIGDAVHNLRAALDMMTWEIVTPQNPPNVRRVQFPKHFECKLKNRYVCLCGQAVEQAFADLKVYPGGNDDLYEIHLLDVTDKHRLILVTTAIASVTRMDLRSVDEAAPPLQIEGNAFLDTELSQIAEWPMVPLGTSLSRANRRLRRNPELRLSFTIDIVSKMGRKRAIPTLRRFADSVEDAIFRVERACLSDGATGGRRPTIGT